MSQNWDDKRLTKMDGLSPEKLLLNPFLYANRMAVTKWLARFDLYRMVDDVKGSVIECGVRDATSLMVYYHLANILRPFDFEEKIVGFDTFSGFPSVSSHDPTDSSIGQECGGIPLQEINEWVRFQDENRPGVGHIPKVELVEGDACVTIPRYVDENPQLIIKLLVLDFDLYEPTKVALEKFVPLMPRGGVVVFDELAEKRWSGETLAFKELMEVNSVSLRRLPYDTHHTYFVV